MISRRPDPDEVLNEARSAHARMLATVALLERFTHELNEQLRVERDEEGEAPG